MKNKLVFLCLLWLVVGVSSAQTKQQISRLYDLCHVWGNLKYFHPEIASGQHDWDSVLVASVNLVLQGGAAPPFREAVDRLIRLAGANPAPAFIIDRSAHPYTYRNINHSWISASRNLDANQKAQLQYNYSHPYQGQNYYAQNNPDDEGNIITPNEKPYPAMKMPGAAYRLLGLFRFWNLINYYYPYKYATDQPWDQVLTTLIPVFIAASNTMAYQKAILKMAAAIDDGHGGVFPFLDLEVAGKYSPPFYFRIVENKAVVTEILDTAAVKAGIRKGSVIETINGLAIRKRVKELWDYVPASNRAGKYRDLHKLILNSGTPAAVYTGYHPDGHPFSVSLQLTASHYISEFLAFHRMTSPVTSRKITDEIAYLYAANITYRNMDSILLPLMKTRAIILDLRNYPRTMPSYALPDYFLEQPTVYSRQTRNDFRYPGLLVYENTNAGTSVETVGKQNADPYRGKLILLVDDRTQSLPEFDCLILKTYRNMVVIGNQTAGADGNQTKMIFPGAYRISFSGFGIYQADGREAQRVGIPVDIPVAYTLQDIINDKDPVLERAIEFAKTGK